MEAETKLADSISIAPDQETRVSEEYSLEEVKAAGRRLDLTKHDSYRFGDRASTEDVNVETASGAPGKDLTPDTQSHVKRYDEGIFSSVWLASRVNSAPGAEYSYSAVPKRKGILVKKLQDEEKASRLVKEETSLWSQDRPRACLGESLVNKKP